MVELAHQDFALFLCGLGLLSIAAIAAGFCENGKDSSSETAPWGLFAAFALLNGLGKWLAAAAVSIPSLEFTSFLPELLSLAALSMLSFRLWKGAGILLASAIPLLGMLLSCLILWHNGEGDSFMRGGLLLICGLATALAFAKAALAAELRRDRIAWLLSAACLTAWLLLDIAAGKFECLQFPLLLYVESAAGFATAIALLMLKLSQDARRGLPWKSASLAQGALLALLAGVAALCGILCNFASKGTDMQIRSSLENEATLCAKAINPAYLRDLTGTRKDFENPRYRRLNKQLAAMAKANPNWRWAYVLGMHEGRLYSLADSQPEEDPGAGPAPYFEAPQKIMELINTRSKGSVGPYTDRWGRWISAFFPIFEDQPGERLAGLFGIDIEASAWELAIAKERLLFIASAVLICLFLLAGITIEGRRIRSEGAQSFAERYAETFHIGLLSLLASCIVAVFVWRSAANAQKNEFAALALHRIEFILNTMLELHRNCNSLESFVSSTGQPSLEGFNLFAASLKRQDEAQCFAYMRFKDGSISNCEIVCGEPAKAFASLLREKPLSNPESLAAAKRSLASGLCESVGPDAGAEKTAPFRGSYQIMRVFQKDRVPSDGILILWHPQGFLRKAMKEASLFYGEETRLNIFINERRDDGCVLVAAWPEGIRPLAASRSLSQSTSISLSGRIFTISCEPSAKFYSSFFHMEAWLALAVGIFLSLCLTVMAYIIQSGRRRAEALVLERTADLKRSQERFSQVSEQSREMIWEIDEQGLFTYVSRGSLSILGASPEELVGLKRIQDFSFGDWYKESSKSFSLQRKISGATRELVRMDGQKIWISRNAIPLRDAAGRFSGFRGSDYDISSSKKAEENFESHAKFLQNMIDAIPNPIYYKNAKGEYLGCNKTFEAYVGLTRTQVIGRTVFEVYPLEFAEKYHKLDMELIKSGGVQRYEAVIRLCSGQTREAIFNKAAFKDAEGNVAGFIGTIVDIAERKKYESEKLRNEAHLDSLLRLSQFHSKSLDDLLDFALEQALRLSGSSLGFVFVRGEGSNDAFNLSSLLSFDGQAVSLPGKDMASSKSVQEALRKAASMTRPQLFNDLSEGALGRFITVPVSKGKGLADAVLIAAGKEKDYENSDLLQLSLLMESIWKIYERNLAEEHVRQDLKSLGIILNILHTAMEDLPLKSVLSLALNGICSMSWFDFTDKCAIQLCDESDGKLRLFVAKGNSFQHCVSCNISPASGDCICGKAFAHGGNLVFSSDDPSHSETHCKIEGPHTHCAVPIRYGQKLLGALNMILDYKHKQTRSEENFLQALSGVLAVIIQRRTADEELRRAHEANKALISSMPLILISLDKEGRILQFNPAAESLFRRKAEDVSGLPLADSAFPWDSKGIADKIEAFKKNPAHPTPEEFHFTRLDGQEGALRIHLSPLPSSAGGAEILLIASDITEWRGLEAQLLQAQKLEAIGQLAAGIAHEINTPTQYIGDNLVFLQEAFKAIVDYIGRLPAKGAAAGAMSPELQAALEEAFVKLDIAFMQEEAPKALQQSIEGVSRIAEIVHAMKEFSHPGAKGKAMVDLNKSISNTVTVARNEWKYVSEVKLNLSPELPSVPCLPGEINQVLLNIIVNAAQAIGERVGKSGEKGFIEITSILDGDFVEIRIQDNGGGIPEKVKRRIFEPFFTTKGVGKGTGQGLSIARGIIVKKHGGELYFESEQGVGTTFVIRLPVVDALLDEASRQKEEEELKI